MKNKPSTLVFYILIIIISIFLEYWTIVASIFIFLGKHSNHKNDSFLVEALLILGILFFLFIIIFTTIKIFRFLIQNN